MDNYKPVHNPLSPRQREVLDMLSKGKSYKEISKELHISGNTVKMHIRKIYINLEAKTIGHAVKISLENKFI